MILTVEELEIILTRRFHFRKDEFKQRIMDSGNEQPAGFVFIPWVQESYGVVDLRWNVFAQEFDQMAFDAYGKRYTVKLN